MHLKGALHIHTTCSDGNLTIRQVVSVYENLGFDFIALTDHDFLIKPGCYSEVGLIETDLIIFTGVELTVFEKGYIHINKINGEKEVLHIFNHPGELGLTFEKAKDRILEVSKRIPIDAVEITSKGFKCPEYNTDEIPFHKVATDDSHNRMGCGRAWIEMDCRRNKDSILRAIKRGSFWNCYKS
ncbi:MAG: hypothetical protein HQK78_07680 [Desulfobacterales bacterium]|nr:hypothetical protein [Desulfobacterales bacterium]